MKTAIKKKMHCTFRMILLTAIFSGGVFLGQAPAQTKSQGVTIGTYDSRVIVFAYTRSDFFKTHQQIFAKQSDSASKAKDTARIKELSVQAMSYQHLLHQMVFGTCSISAIIDLVKERLPELAQKEQVSIIVSKFEIPFQDASVKSVDLTEAVAQLFHPTEDIKSMSDEIRKSDPVPLEELTLESDMLDLYCKRFGKK